MSFQPSPRWTKVRTIKFDDADVDVAATTATLTAVPLNPGTSHLIVEETLVVVRTQFAGNAGTAQLDVGKSGSLEIYAKDVDLKSASGTRVLGSGTTSVKPRIVEANGLPVVLTVISGSGNLSTLSAGEADVYVLWGPAPPAA
jgi:hypothetical protein